MSKVIIGVIVVFLTFMVTFSAGILCYNCNESPLSNNGMPVCFNVTSQTANIGILKECEFRQGACFVTFHRQSHYQTEFDSENVLPTGVAEKGCKGTSDGSDHLMKCFLVGSTKKTCFCNDRDGCNNGSPRYFLSAFMSTILTLLHLIMS